MATNNYTVVDIPVTTSHHGVPAVIPFPAPPAEEITQFEIAAILSLRSRAEKLNKEVQEAEQSIRTRLQAGAAVEAGERTAALKTSPGRRNVSWKEVATRLGDRLFGTGKGASYCERVLRSTKPTPTTTLELA